MSDSDNETPIWPTQEETAEKILEQLASSGGGRLERDVVGRLVLVRDPKQR